MTSTTFYLYLITWTLVALSPGPAAICIMSQATRHSVRASFAGISGIQTGNVVFFVCIAFGLASLLATATTAFTVLRLIGAAYLCWLGLRVIIGTFHKPEATPDMAPKPVPKATSLFLQGLLIQITNPKALLFMSALLPQFIDSHRPLAPQIAILMATTIAVDVAVMWGYATLAANGSRTLRSSALACWIERAFGAVLIAFGLRIAASLASSSKP